MKNFFILINMSPLIIAVAVAIIGIIIFAVVKSKGSKSYRLYTGKDSAGNDIRAITEFGPGGFNENVCKNACDADPKCVGFDFIRNNDKGYPIKCQLKSKINYPLSNWAPEGGIFVKG